jgi:redox-sensitive bicupin YhaK (pirin superfamily)
VHLAAPDVPVELAVPDGHNLVVFVRAGAARIGAPGDERAVGPQGVALMQRAGTTLRLSAAAPDTRLLLLGGAPLDEPIAARGPFVMNTREELAQANADFRSGRMGT